MAWSIRAIALCSTSAIQSMAARIGTERIVLIEPHRLGVDAKILSRAEAIHRSVYLGYSAQS